MGEDSVRKWLTSLLISLFTSVILTQPIQVALITFILVAIFRAIDENSYTPEGQDHEDSQQPFNTYNSDILLNNNMRKVICFFNVFLFFKNHSLINLKINLE